METVDLDKMSDVTITNEEETKQDESVFEKAIGVYVKYDENGNIIEVNSDIFIRDLTGWTKIDEGYGDKFAHAQSQYFDKPLMNENGTYNYKIEQKA